MDRCRSGAVRHPVDPDGKTDSAGRYCRNNPIFGEQAGGNAYGPSDKGVRRTCPLTAAFTGWERLMNAGQSKPREKLFGLAAFSDGSRLILSGSRKKLKKRLKTVDSFKEGYNKRKLRIVK